MPKAASPVCSHPTTASRITSGVVSDSLVQLADLTEGIACAAGVEEQLPPTGAERVDLFAAATGPGRGYAISEREPFNDRSARAFQKRNPSVDVEAFLCDITVVVRDGWKLIDRSDGRRELYRLENDRGFLAADRVAGDGVR